MNFIKDKIEYLKTNKIAKLFIVIFTGSGIVAVCGFASTWLVVDAIGLKDKGVLYLIITFTWFVFNIFSFKPFLALIKFMTDSVQKNDHDRTKLYIKTSFLLDIISLSLMLIVGILLRDQMIKWMKWDEAIKPYTTIYLISFMIFFQGTCQGVLRTFEKYHLVVKVQITVAIVKCILYGIGWFMKFDFTYFFIVELLVTSLLNSIGLLFYTFRTLKENNLLDFYKVKLRFDKEFIMFNVHTNLVSTLDLPVNQVTTLIIGGVLGSTAVAIFGIFEQIGQVIYKLAEPINQIMFPEVSQRIARKEYDDAKNISNKLKKYMGLLGAGVLLVIALTYSLWAEMLIKGDGINAMDYLIPLLIYLGYLVFINAHTGSHSLFLGLGYIRYSVPLQAIVDIIYLISLYLAIKPFGFLGVVIVYFAQAFLIVMTKEYIIKKNNYREYHRKDRG